MPKLPIIFVLIFSTWLFFDTIVGQQNEKLYYEIQVEKISIPKNGGKFEENVVCEMSSDCNESGRWPKVVVSKIQFGADTDKQVIMLSLWKNASCELSSKCWPEKK